MSLEQFENDVNSVIRGLRNLNSKKMLQEQQENRMQLSKQAETKLKIKALQELSQYQSLESENPEQYKRDVEIWESIVKWINRQTEEGK